MWRKTSTIRLLQQVRRVLAEAPQFRVHVVPRSVRGVPSGRALPFAVGEAHIASGEYKSGERIPSLVALIEGFGIANATGQKVIRALRADGLIHTEPGMGSFVTTAEERDKPEWPGPEARELTATVDGGENVDQPGQTA
ncbi:GntR family transcriptional regulator [Microbispora sp. NBRC 16548]|uniref:GntR family transcriptional regulator n=1 Tax=Microbispora sp. NBRC 16548 TaxID=3030994 RepID=UPI0024A4AFE4|nr:GntR family transcriptional regulator [Microbispora sp. NBRC 16548]GLX08218.1 hypothetical protein Misp03_51440 [Microbispora sp. NBRC 16548]